MLLVLCLLPLLLCPLILFSFLLPPLLPFLLPYLPLFFFLLRGRPIPLTPLLFPLFLLRSPLLPRLPFLLFLLLSLLPWLRPLSCPLPLFPPPFLFPLPPSLRLLLLLPRGLILLFIPLLLSFRLLFLLHLLRSLPFPLFLLLLVSLLPLSLPRLLLLPPLFLLFLLLLFYHLLPLPLFSQFLLPRLVGFLIPLQFLPLSSSSSSSFGAISSLADHQALLLGLSSEYQSLPRWFLSSGGSDFAALVRSSFLYLLPDLSRDFTSGSSLFLTTLRSAPPLPLPPASSAPLSGAPLSSSLRLGVPAPPPSASLSSSFPPLATPSASVPPPPGFPPLPSHPSLGSGASLLVPGLGVGVPPPSGVPPYSVTSAAFAYPAAPPAPAYAPAPQPPAAAWPQPYPPAPFAHLSHGAAADPYVDDDDDDRLPSDVHDPLDPSTPPLGLESTRSEYRRMIDYICGLFPQAVGVPPSAPPPRALFESFFAPAAQATPSVQLNWFDRVRTSLLEADSRVAPLLSSGRPERLVVPTRAPSYAVRGDCSLGHAVPVDESLLSHFEHPLRPSL